METVGQMEHSYKDATCICHRAGVRVEGSYINIKILVA